MGISIHILIKKTKETNNFDSHVSWVTPGVNAITRGHTITWEMFTSFREQVGDLLPADLAGEFLDTVTERTTAVRRRGATPNRSSMDSYVTTQSCPWIKALSQEKIIIKLHSFHVLLYNLLQNNQSIRRQRGDFPNSLTPNQHRSP